MNETLADKLKRSSPGETQEETNSLTGKAGLYRHPGSGEELITLHDPLLGDAQSEAAIRVGFKRVRDAKPEEVKILAIASTDAENERSKTNDNSDALKGLSARLNALEAENAKLKEEAGKTPSTADQAKEDAKDEAEKQVERRGTENDGDEAATGGVNTQEDSDESDEEETEAAEYQEKTDKKGNTYHVGPDGKRVSKEEYEKNVNKEGN